MTTEAPSASAIFMARLAVALVVGLIILGVFRYGVSSTVLERFWNDLTARPGGPMTFRFILQPTMAAIAALRDGRKDARLGRAPYFWALVHEPEERAARLSEGVIATARIVLLGLGMDAIYQYEVLKTFYPAEAVLVALLLACLVNMTAYPLSNGLLPYVVKEVYGIGQAGLGYLVASFAIGGLVGSVAVSMNGGIIRPARTMIISAVAWYTMLFVFAL